jgi:hypothetical protein
MKKLATVLAIIALLPVTGGFCTHTNAQRNESRIRSPYAIRLMYMDELFDLVRL